MTIKRALEFASHIYDAVLEQNFWDGILDEFTEVIGAGAATLQIIDNKYTENKCEKMSVLFRNDPDREKKFQPYFGTLWKYDSRAYEYAHNHPELGFIPDYVALGIHPSALATHPPSIWLKESFGLYHRVACRLSTSNAWYDYLTVQYRSNRNEATLEELMFANLFIPHFARAVELGRTFAVLKTHFNATLMALDHYLIGTFIVASDGTLFLENKEGRRLLNNKDGLSKHPTGCIRLTIGDNAKFLNFIRQVSATACGEGMEAEKVMTVPRRSAKDPYLLTICPLRDSENTLDCYFRGAIVYAIDPSRISIVSTDGIASLYKLTPAENAVCTLLVEGLTTEQIAETRSVKVETIQSQVKILMDKTGVNSRIRLIKLALSINLPIDHSSGAAKST